MKNLKVKFLAFWFAIATNFLFATANYSGIIDESKKASDAFGNVGGSWIGIVIAWTPMWAIGAAIFGIYKYQKKKAQQEQEEGSIKIFFMWLLFLFIAVVILTGIFSLFTSWVAGDASLATNIMHSYWAKFLKSGI